MTRVLGGALTGRARARARNSGRRDTRDAEEIEQHVRSVRSSAPRRNSRRFPSPCRSQGDAGVTNSGRPKRRACFAVERAPLFTGACTTTVAWRQRGEHAVAQVKRPQRGVTFELERRNEGPPFGDQLVVQLLVFGGVTVVKPGRHYRDGCPTSVESSAVRGGVDAQRTARPDRHPPQCERARQFVGVVKRLFRRVARPYDGDPGTREQLTANTKGIGRMGELAEQVGIVASVGSERRASPPWWRSRSRASRVERERRLADVSLLRSAVHLRAGRARALGGFHGKNDRHRKERGVHITIFAGGDARGSSRRLIGHRRNTAPARRR